MSPRGCASLPPMVLRSSSDSSATAHVKWPCGRRCRRHHPLLHVTPCATTAAIGPRTGNATMVDPALNSLFATSPPIALTVVAVVHLRRPPRFRRTSHRIIRLLRRRRHRRQVRTHQAWLCAGRHSQQTPLLRRVGRGAALWPPTCPLIALDATAERAPFAGHRRLHQPCHPHLSARASSRYAATSPSW